MKPGLEDKVAFATASHRGIGGETARVLTDQDACVPGRAARGRQMRTLTTAWSITAPHSR